MRLPHCIAFFYYLPWFVDVYGKKSYYFENATQCGKRMQKPVVATRLYCINKKLETMQIKGTGQN